VEGDIGEVWKVLRNDPKFELVIGEYGGVIRVGFRAGRQ
jgi:hypothetical protein